jgi:protein N-terminal methyltransferase
VEGDKENSWYRPAVEYWDKQEASYDGVLGGYGSVSDTDVAESDKFLKKAFGKVLEEGSAGKRQLVAAGEMFKQVMQGTCWV